MGVRRGGVVFASGGGIDVAAVAVFAACLCFCFCSLSLQLLARWGSAVARGV